ncbi:MAG: alcohol dehydrogenase catalytic domain-containing protein [Desulfobulbaceae bacterium]|nr:alcohol dehydrogenase catalytic domain-containing protein [Desulfobulbaceae bacterium]
MPEPAAGEALVRVLMAGICATDLEIIKGYQRFCGILGHEFVGRVEAVNGPGQELVGRRVVGEINIGCGECDFCGQGLVGHCRNRQVLGIHGRDGALADYLTLPVGNLHPVPAEISDEAAVFVEPLAAAFAVLEQVDLRNGDKVLVLGDGKLGLLIAQVLKTVTPEVTLVGHHPAKLALAQDCGIRTIMANEMTAAKQYDLVVEATGSALGLKDALQQVRPRGTVVLKSTVAEGAPLNLAPAVVDEITMVGSRCGSFPPALAALAEGKVAVVPLIDAVFPAEQALAALARAGSRGVLKVLVDFRDGLVA